MDEINEYEKKTKLQEEGLKKDNTEDKTEEVVVNVVKIKDYKKTSLLKPVNVFNEFLRGLKKAATEAKVEGIYQEYCVWVTYFFFSVASVQE